VVDLGSINSNMKLGLYGGILVLIGGFLTLIGGSVGYYGIGFGYIDIGRVILGIIIMLVPLVPQFNIQIEDRMLALALLGLGAIAALWGLATLAWGYWWIGALLDGLFSLIGGALAAFGGWKAYESVTGKPLIQQQAKPAARKAPAKKRGGPKY